MTNAVVASELLIKMAVDYAGMKADMDKVTKSVGASGKEMGQALDIAKKAFVAFAGVASVGAFASMIKDTISATGHFNDLAATAGVSASQLMALSKVASFSGVSAEEMAGSMNKLNLQLVKQGEDGKGASAALKAIGLNYGDFMKLDPDKRMTAIAQAMAGYKDGSEKSAIAMALFGKTGAALVPVLKDIATAGDLVAKATDEQIAMADDFDDNLKRLDASGGKWKQTLSMGMLPALNDAAIAFLGAANETGGFNDKIKELSKDGTIDKWTRGAITGLTYLMDTFEGVIRVVRSVGETIGAGFAQIVTYVTGGVDAAKKALTGDFSGAMKAWGDSVKQADSITAEFNQSMKKVWTDPTVGQGIRDRMEATAAMREKQKQLGDTTEDSKKKIDTSGLSADNADALKKQKDETEKLIKAGNDLVKSLTNQQAALKLQLATGKELSPAQKELIKLEQDLNDKKIILTASQIKQAQATIAANQVMRDQIQIEAEVRKIQQARIETIEKQAQAIGDDARKQKEWNDTALLTKKQLSDLEIGRLKNQIRIEEETVATFDLIEACTQESEAHRDTLKALKDLADAKEKGVAVQAAKDANEEWRKTVDSIKDGLTDSLMRAFESGKGFADAFKDTLINAFKTMILKPTIQGIIGSVFGGGSGSDGAEGSGDGGLGSSIGSLVTSAKTAYGYMQKAYSFMSGGYKSMGGMGTAGAYLGGAAIGIGAGRAISGEFSLGGNKNTAVVVGTAIGAIWGPIGAAIGGMIGGLVNRAFGMGEKKIKESGITGTLGGGNATGQTYADWKQKGGWFRSDKSGTNYGQINEEMGKALDDGAKAVYEQTKSWAQALGLPAEKLANATTDFRIAISDDEKANNAAITKLFTGYQATLAEQFESVLKPFQQAGETVLQTMQRLLALDDFSHSINQLGGVFSDIASSSTAARQSLIDMAGGINALMAASQQFVADYYSVDEKSGMQAKGTLQGLASVGIDASTLATKEDYRALVEATGARVKDGDTTAQAQLVALLQLGPQFAQLADYLKEKNETLGDAAKQAPEIALLEQLIPTQADTETAVNEVAGVVATGNAILERLVSAVMEGNTSISSGLAQIANNASIQAGLNQRALDIAEKNARATAEAMARASHDYSQPSYTYNVGGDA